MNLDSLNPFFGVSYKSSICIVIWKLILVAQLAKTVFGIELKQETVHLNCKNWSFQANTQTRLLIMVRIGYDCHIHRNNNDHIFVLKMNNNVFAVNNIPELR